MKLLFNNQPLIDYAGERAILQAPVNSGSNVALSVDDNNGFVQYDFVVVGNFLSAKTEIAKINASVTAGTALQADSLVFTHSEGSPVTKITHDKVRMYSATTINGAKTLVEEKDVDVDQENTEFELADSSTGYRFFVLYNSYTTTEGEYSPAINVGQLPSTRSYGAIYNFVKLQYPDEFTQEAFETFLQLAIDEIFSIRAWSFREAKTTFTTTIGVYEYSIKEDVGIEDFGTLVSARTATEMLQPISIDEDDKISLNGNGIVPHTICEWSGKLYIRVPSSETITFRYLKSTEALLTSQSETGIKLSSAVVFRILTLLYLTKDQKLSDRFGMEYQRAIKLMKHLDEKNSSVRTLTEHTGSRSGFTTPNIISG